MTKKLCISGYYGFDNFGDETILKVLVENIKKFENIQQITVFSSNPSKTGENLGVNSVHSFNLKEVIKSLIKCDCLISGGGSLLQDVTSIKSLIYYLGIISLAQLFNKKTIIFAQGIGPINNKYLKTITKLVLRKASFVTVRDDNSLNLLQDWNINAIKCSDAVWNLVPTSKQKTNKIGIQLRECSLASEEFIQELATSIIKHYPNKEIVLLSLQNKLDLDICENLKEKIKSIDNNIQVKVIENTSNEKVIEDISELEELIAMRFHACLIAIKNNVKLLPINYDIKVEELAKEFNLRTINKNEIQNIENSINEFKNTNIDYNKETIEAHTFNFKMLESII